jgi:hypothetical protein|tara:strand:- start:300 stop:533 length:234 start_codon:yes stop_codon:yes gene_type:complete
MEMQTAFDVVLGGFMLLASFFMKIFWDMLQDTRKEMYDAERRSMETYVRRDDYRMDMDELRDMFTRILDKLDNKADK